jgi:hypothetical protein
MAELCNLGCQAGPADPRIAAMLRPENRPARLRTAPVAQLYDGDPPACRRELQKSLRIEIGWLKEQAEALQAEEGRELIALLDDCATVQDPGQANRYHRVSAECSSKFHRAHAALRAMARERRKLEEEREGSSDSRGPRGGAEPAGGADAAGSAGAIEGAGGDVPGPGDAAPARNEPGGAVEADEAVARNEPSGGPDAAGEAGTRNEPSVGLEATAAVTLAESGAGPGASRQAGEAGARNEPRPVAGVVPTWPPAAVEGDRGGAPEEGDYIPPLGGFWKARGLSGGQATEVWKGLRGGPQPEPPDGSAAAGSAGPEGPGSDLASQAWGQVVRTLGGTVPHP